MTDDKRKKKKKRGRSKIILGSCFRSTTGDGPSSSSPPDKSDANRNDEKLGKPPVVVNGRDFVLEVDLVNGCDNVVDDDDCCTKRSSSSSSRRRISRLLKAVLFNPKSKKTRTSSFKSSIASDTSSSPLSTEKVEKSFNDGNAYARECPDMDDSCSRRSNLFSSSSRTTSSACSTSSRTTSSAYSTSSLSSTNTNSGSTSNQKTLFQLDNILEFRYPVSSNSSASKKPNPINNSNYSSSCFDQKVSSSKSTPIRSISPSVSHQKGLSRLNSADSTTSVSSNMFLLMNSNPDKLIFGGNSWNIRCCLFLLLSLVVLMIWGRIFSIMCTSIWFYFVPCCRIKRADSATSMAEFVDMDSKHYKKRVIMAGLLDRTRKPSGSSGFLKGR